MKMIVKYSLGFLLLLAAEATEAQQVVNNKSYNAIPSKTTAKGRRELRKDKRIKRHEAHALKANEKNLEAEANKPFHKKKHPKVPKDKKVEIRKNE